MKRFRYAFDPLCLLACFLYVLQRWVINAPSLRGWFVDILLIPAGAPIFLWVERVLTLRNHDAFPTKGEIAFLFVVWSIAAEIIAPALFSRCTADPQDVLCYAIGALISMAWWSLRKK